MTSLNESQIFHYLPVVFHRVVSRRDLFRRNIFSVNKFDIGKNLYSRADEMPSFIGPDGLFHFELCYPELSTTCYKWYQSSNPMDPSIRSVQGFNFKASSYVDNAVYPFTGLLADTR